CGADAAAGSRHEHDGQTLLPGHCSLPSSPALTVGHSLRITEYIAESRATMFSSPAAYDPRWLRKIPSKVAPMRRIAVWLCVLRASVQIETRCTFQLSNALLNR